MYHCSTCICDHWQRRELSRGHTILTSRELMWCYACSWDVRGDLPLNSMAQIHASVTLLTSRDLTCQQASHISVVAHISWDVTTWPTCRVLFRRCQSVVCRKICCLCRRPHWDRYGWNVISPTAWRQKLTWDNVKWRYGCVPPHMTWAHVTWG